jgi:ubiquinone/menaquinone biosynthesis C-methylase UbiE
MNNPAPDAQIAAAETYQRLFVPAEFEQWAARVLAAAGVRTGDRVLDVACGTGVLAREAARSVGPSGFVAGLDPHPGMLAVAARLSPSIEWRLGDAHALPYADASFDAVVSQFGLMYFADRRLALREMLRVAAGGGRLAIAVWDSLERTPAYADLVSLLERTAGQQAADALRKPFALGDRDALAALVEDAGIPEAEITTHHGTGQFPTVRTMVEAELRGWLPLVGIMLPDAAVDRIVEEAEGILSRYAVADGSVRFDAPAHIITGTKR